MTAALSTGYWRVKKATLQGGALHLEGTNLARVPLDPPTPFFWGLEVSRNLLDHRYDWSECEFVGFSSPWPKVAS